MKFTEIITKNKERLYYLGVILVILTGFMSPTFFSLLIAIAGIGLVLVSVDD